MKKLIITLPLLFACSHSPLQRQIASSSEKPVLQLLKKLQLEVENNANNPVGLQACADLSKKYFGQFYNLKAEDNLDGITSNEFDEIIELSFRIRLSMREQLPMLIPGNPGVQECLSGVRNITRALRYVEDYFIGYYSDKDAKPEEYTTLAGDGAYFLRNGFESADDFKSGDVILSRGNAYTSAAIARIGADDAQFSHLSLVYKDDAGLLHTMEAHIEIGSVTKPIGVHIDQKNARTVVLRYKDPKVAHEAAKFMYNRVKKEQDKGKNIKYDFGMDYKDSSKLFCSEIISQGFRDTAKVDVPLFKTKFNKGLMPFLQGLGIKVNDKNIADFDTFGPGDTEFDSRFSLLAEWRNPAKIKEIRIKDALLTKMFEWIEEKNYKFHPRFKINASSYVAWTLRRLPFLKKSFIEKFPTNMTADQLQLFMVLEKVGEILHEELSKVQDTKQYPMTLKEMFEELEKIRENDLSVYKESKKKSLFHRYFKPDKEKKK